MKETRTFIWSDRKRTAFGLPWTFTKYCLTPEKLLIQSGIFNTKEEEIRLYRIMDVTLKRSFIERVFGLGTIHCCSADKSTPEFDIVWIKDAAKVKELFSDMIEKERMQKRVTSREFMTDEETDFDPESLP
ncbi:PH domain-containing protein [uncultured Ruthenibacterium sp.]|mgnify:CR=1 FL=1|uniref:PH domain-containing protein n=1 Tax=uncultured Ruthenibacterium sp. TaxID=1905347 RepID=UPI00349E708E